MRKADYATLAQLIQQEHAHARKCVAESWRPPETLANFEGQSHALEWLAKEFAKSASVNPAEFLKACGIDP